MAWMNIAVSEVDTNSPTNQTLMAKVQNNLNVLYAAMNMGSQLYSNGTVDNSDATGDEVIDNTVDWRDRYITVNGIVGTGPLTQAQAFVPGGAHDDQINTYGGGRVVDTTLVITPVTDNDDDATIRPMFFYSSTGSGSRSTDPYIYFRSTVTVTRKYYIWVRSSDGALMLGWDLTDCDINKRSLAWNLHVMYSGDQGGHV